MDPNFSSRNITSVIIHDTEIENEPTRLTLEQHPGQVGGTTHKKVSQGPHMLSCQTL